MYVLMNVQFAFLFAVPELQYNSWRLAIAGCHFQFCLVFVAHPRGNVASGGIRMAGFIPLKWHSEFSPPKIPGPQKRQGLFSQTFPVNAVLRPAFVLKSSQIRRPQWHFHTVLISIQETGSQLILNRLSDGSPVSSQPTAQQFRFFLV